MFDYLKQDRWSAYVVGVALAILSIASFLYAGRMLGSSATFVYIAAGLLHLIFPTYVENNVYYASYLAQGAWITWQFALLIGVFFGSYLAHKLSDSPRQNTIPLLWENSFGPNPIIRYIGAFLGGIIIIFGARLAGGCTSGHAITNGMQLAVSGWIFMISLFAAAIPTAYILYGRKGN